MRASDDASRRILSSPGRDHRLSVLGIREGDLSVLVGIPLFVGLGGSVLVESLAVPALVLGSVLAIGIVYVTPAHLSASEWLSDLVRFARRRPVSVCGQPSQATPSRRHPFTITEDASELTTVVGGWADESTVLRADGSIQTYLELAPGNMDFAMSQDWANVQSAAAGFANDDLTFELSLYATTRSFATDHLVESLTERLDDPDIQGNETLAKLVESYIDSRPAEANDRGAREVHYYLGVTASAAEALERFDRERTPVEKLARIPLIGILLLPVLARRRRRSEEATHEAQLRLLGERVRLVRRGLVDAIDGWSARRLPTAELLALEFEYWNGDQADVDPTALVRTNATLGREHRNETRQSDTDGGETTAESTTTESATSPETERAPDDDSLRTQYRTTMAPEAAIWKTRSARLDDTWTSTLHIAGYPDYPKDGYLSALFDQTDVSFDVMARLSPVARQRAREDLRESADDLSVETELEQTSRQAHLGHLAAGATDAYTAIEDGTRLFEQSMLLVVRADSPERLRDARGEVQRVLRDAPANLVPKPAICRQDLGLRAAAPFGEDEFGRPVRALGGAVGALLASPHEAALLEDGGVEVGVNRENGSPIVVDRFARENGYASFTVGDTGSGKSFSAKQQFVRSVQASEDRIGIVLEPLNNWAGVCEALGADRITVGGTLGLNPLELRETPKSVIDAMGADASPFTEKLDDVLSFFSNFFALRQIDLADRRPTLEFALIETYDRAGITERLDTHDRSSPTITDLLDVLADLVAEPEAYTVRRRAEADRLRSDAAWFLTQFRPFAPGGRYENLGRASEFDMGESSVVYFDLGQQEGSRGGSAALTMQLLVSLAYEHAKVTDKEVVFVIDEARYLMRNDAHLGYLETVFRHHRHHDLSVRLVTQTVDEFFEHTAGEAIIDQCGVKQFHRLDGMNGEWAAEFGLNHAQMRFVQNAAPGSADRGYAEALIEIDGEWRGIEVRATDAEHQIID